MIEEIPFGGVDVVAFMENKYEDYPQIFVLYDNLIKHLGEIIVKKLRMKKKT